jgi:hypothetical protein
MLQELYEQLNDSSLSEEHEKIFINMFNKFLENYNSKNINSKNFDNFKKDAYLLFNGLYKFMFEEDIDNQDDITEEEIITYNEMKSHVEYIIYNIKDIEYEAEENYSIYNSIKFVSEFIEQRSIDIKEINNIIEDNTNILEKCTNHLEINLKIREIIEKIKTNVDLGYLNASKNYLDEILDNFSVEDKLLVMQDIEKNIDYKKKINEIQNKDIIDRYNELIIINNIINLKSVLISKLRLLNN